MLPNPKLRFLDQCREVLHFKQRSLRTEEACVDWTRRFMTGRIVGAGITLQENIG